MKPKGAELVVEDNGSGLPDTSKEDDGQDKVEAEGLGTKIAALLTRQFAGEISHEPMRSNANRPARASSFG